MEVDDRRGASPEPGVDRYRMTRVTSGPIPSSPAFPAIDVGATWPRCPGLDVRAEVGRGAGCTVYRASRVGVDYALKILDEPPSDLAGVLARFRREAALLAGVSDPRLPVIHEVGQVDGRPYLVMDLFDGRPLAELVEDGPLEPSRAIAVLLDVVEPLALLHDRGLLHRDLKPPNIIVVGESSARVIDFGLAAHGEARSVGVGPSARVVGTLAYAAPEQSGVLRRPVDHRSDLYSLGVVLFECLTGVLPFAAADTGELLRRHATEAAPDPRTLAPVGPGIAAVVAVMLAKDPDDRYQSAHELAADLRRLVADPDAALAMRGGIPHRRRGRLCGRDSELAVLTGIWRQVRAGRGANCGMVGPSGIGLTRLAEEVAALARADGAVVLQVRDRDGKGVPLSALRRGIDDWLREIEDLPAAAREEMHARIRAAAGASAGPVADVSPHLAAVLKTLQLAESDRPDQAAGVVAGFLAELARLHGAMLVVMDDAPTLDAATGRILAQVCTHGDPAPLMTLSTTCLDRVSCSDLPDEVEAISIDAQLVLEPLDEEGIAELVASRLPGIGPQSWLGELLVRRGQGNPLITIEYLRAIVDAGLLSPHWGSWIVDEDGLDALDLADDALGIVVARLDRLDEDSRRLLVMAAILGTVFRSQILVEASDPDRVRAMLAAAAAEHLVEPLDDGVYRFLHAGIPQAMVASLTAAALADMHHAIAEALDRRLYALPAGSPWVEDVTYAAAYHYLHGDRQRCGARAVELWRQAGQLALAALEPAMAASLLEPVAAATPADPGLMIALATALTQDGRHPAARDHLDQALALVNDPIGRARILLLIATVERSSGNNHSALAAAERGLAELGRTLPSSGRFATPLALLQLVRVVLGVGGAGGGRIREALIAELHAEAQYTCMLAGRTRRMRLHAAFGAVSLARLRRGPVYAHGVAALALTAELSGLSVVAAALMAWAGRVAEPLADPQVLATLAWYRGSSAYHGGRDDGELWQQAVERHRSWIDPGLVTATTAALTWQAAGLGRVAQAQAVFERGVSRTTTSPEDDVAVLVELRVMLHAVAGRPADAMAELERLEALAAASDQELRLPYSVCARVFALVEQGEFGAPFDRAVENFDALAVRPDRTPRPYRIAFAYVAIGRLAQARAAATSGKPSARAAVVAAARARRNLQLAAGHDATLRAFIEVITAELQRLRGRPDRALRTLARIRPQRQEAPVLDVERAMASARALAAAGHSAAARHNARIALAVANDAGLMRRARAVVREFGLRPAPSPAALAATSTTARSGGIDGQRLAALQEISRAASRVLDFGQLVRICLDRMLGILSAERAVLFLVGENASHGEQLVPYLGRDSDGNDVPRLTGYSTSLVERVRLTEEPVVVTGTEEGAALGAQSVVVHGLRSIMVAPLLLEGRLLGVVYLDSQVATGIFGADDIDILTALMTHIATSLETARAAELEVSVRAARRQRDFAEGLRVALEDMSAALDPDDVLSRLMTALTRTLPGVEAVLIPFGATELRDIEIQAVTDGRGLVDGAAPVPKALSGHVPPGSVWSLHPLQTTEQLIGMLVLTAPTTEALSPTQLDLAAALVGQATTAYDRAALFARVQELAVVDDLTGIPNRRRFFEVAERDVAAARLHGRPLQAMMIDIDHFKRVNDTFGHSIGDEVIRTVAQRLRRHTREVDILGRYGGEEFALVTSDVADVAAFAEQLRAAVAGSPVPTATGLMSVTVSVGVAELTNADTGVAALLARADAALYDAKQRGRNRVVVG